MTYRKNSNQGWGQKIDEPCTNGNYLLKYISARKIVQIWYGGHHRSLRQYRLWTFKLEIKNTKIQSNRFERKFCIFWNTIIEKIEKSGTENFAIFKPKRHSITKTSSVLLSIEHFFNVFFHISHLRKIMFF